MTPLPWMLLPAALATLAIFLVWRAGRRRRRRAFIEAYGFAPHLRAQVHQAWPHLGDAALNDVERGLRQAAREVHVRAFIHGRLLCSHVQ